ncbi:MAG: arsenate reductase family protein [Candidatus Omnitrophica bacterium]|nr:arsenate reductase family protein [Candidatus Omnitrophota bacterium]
MIQLFGYAQCSTCVKAKKYLSEHNIPFVFVDIIETPPSKDLLEHILQSGNYEVKELFNTSGVMYRAMKLADKIPSMGEEETLELLARNGKLIKRPLITDGARHVVGFDPEMIQSLWA